MPELPSDVIEYLLDNPREVERIQIEIQRKVENARWRAQLVEQRKNAAVVPCGVYGCTNLKNAMDPMCENCVAEWKEDPDAFK